MKTGRNSTTPQKYKKKKNTVPATKPTNLVAVEKQRRAYHFRMSGMNYEDVARASGYSSGKAASNAVRRLMKKVIIESTEDIRAVQYDRLNFMLMVCWRDVQDGDKRAIETALRIQDQINKLLGIEVPVKQEVEHKGGVLVINSNTEDYIAAMKLMAGVQEGPQQPAAIMEASATELIPVIPQHEGAPASAMQAIPNNGSGGRKNGQGPKQGKKNRQQPGQP